MAYRRLTLVTARPKARRAARLITSGLLLPMLLLALSGCPASRPLLRANPLAFDFGPEATSRSFTLTNGGNAPLEWSIPETPGWLTASPSSGTIATGSQVVTLTASRVGLLEGPTQAEFRIESNGGSQVLAASITTPKEGVLTVDPASVALGTEGMEGAFAVRNSGGLPVEWEIALPGNAPWLTGVTPQAGSTEGGEATTVTFTVNREGLATGFYLTDIVVRSGPTELLVRVTLTVPGATGVLEATPTVFEFGARTEEAALTVQNAGQAALAWSTSDIEYGGDPHAFWLDVEPIAGTDPLGPGQSQQVSLSVNRATLPDGDYTAAFSVYQVSGETILASIPITVKMSVRGPELVVAPAVLRFGESALQKIVSVSNGGTGEVHWQAEFVGAPPGWANLTATEGVVADTPQSVLITVDRTGLLEGDYAATLRFTALDGSGAPLVGTDVILSMGVAQGNPPRINVAVIGADGASIISEGTDLELQVGALLEDTTRKLRIGNAGGDELNWALDAGELPAWLNVAPTAGTTMKIPNEIEVTVLFDRLPVEPVQHTLTFSSNGAGGGAASVIVKAARKQRSLIGIAPGSLAFGVGLDSDILEVFNLAPRGERLDFMVTSDAPWLLTTPMLGTSFGTSPAGLDRQVVRVAVNRRCLTASGELGFITVQGYVAEGAGPDRVIEPDPTIAPVQIPVTVEAQPLGLRTAAPWMVTPSRVRFPFVMYDSAVNPVKMVNAAALAERVGIYEDGIPLETTETSVEVTDDYRINLVVILDYSGSMFAAAQGIDDAPIPGSPDPLHDCYLQTVAEEILLNTIDLPLATTQIALWAIYDRHQPTRELHGFTTDRFAVGSALADFVPPTHGASELLPAVDAAVTELFQRETAESGYDGAVINAVLFITDGRDTTPPGIIESTILAAQDARVRTFNVSWGVEPADGTLALLSNATFGQFYPTSTACLPGQEPRASRQRMADGVAAAVRDLGSHFVMTYTTLNEKNNVPVRFELTLEQGGVKISGSTPEYLLNLGAISPAG